MTRIKHLTAVSLLALLAACNNAQTPTSNDGSSATVAAGSADHAGHDETQAAEKPLHVVVLDCGTIDVSDLDVFSMAGDYAGQSDTFANTCYLVHHPKGYLLWDMGLPGMLAGAPAQQNGVFTVSLERSLTDQLRDHNLTPADLDYVAISHSHFDHTGQADQFAGRNWIVHQAEYDAMFPADGSDAVDAAGGGFTAFEAMSAQPFTGEKDVFGDGSVVIFETPGHTPGHTSLQLILPEMGPVLLTGDLYHRTESRTLARVPKFNWDVTNPPEGFAPGERSAASIAAFEARATKLGAKVIIQHEKDDIDALPDVLR